MNEVCFLAKLQINGSVTNFEARLKRKDGSTWWASTNAHFFKDINGVIKGIEGITRDISDLKSTENALKEVRTVPECFTMPLLVAFLFMTKESF